jgi:hypothetical protein
MLSLPLMSLVPILSSTMCGRELLMALSMTPAICEIFQPPCPS